MTSTFTAGPKGKKYINFVITAPSKTIDVAVLITRFKANGELNITSVSEMSSAILKKREEHSANLIGQLTIYAHANPDGVAIGKDYINLDNFNKYKSDLSSLSPLFQPGVSFVHFASCKLGNNPTLISRFSQAWNGATVRAFKENQYAEDEWPMGTGPFVTCEMHMCEVGGAR